MGGKTGQLSMKEPECEGLENSQPNHIAKKKKKKKMRGAASGDNTQGVAGQLFVKS